ncbi:protein FAR-RED ELONGATED HYPOCOTYL 3-like [Carya illinoinensis]|uniref:protein FAR-RED ELONGATED HYPOCOTYL 3-like n=1 Tax=Carya illinoinensis TaxID=32201 RepID=UPI001C71FC58|nr:protein FAR-RED ELONGATED HYPOCOTYL 3-like [Carya illinoinensis]
MVDNALRKKVEVKMTIDFNSCNQTIPYVSPFCLEKQFQVLYAYAKFKKVQREVWGMICCNYVLVSKEGCISTYNVLDEISTDDYVKTIKYLVYYNEEECDVKCMCTLFEMRGILCRHIFKVFQMKKIYVLPNKYVFDQWRNDLKRIYTLVKTSYDNLRDNANARMYEVLDEFEHNFIGLTLEPGSTKVKESLVMDKGKKILSPHVVQGKWRPPTKRKTCREIFDDKQVGEVLDAELGANAEDVIRTQCSIVTQPTLAGNDDLQG